MPNYKLIRSPLPSVSDCIDKGIMPDFGDVRYIEGLALLGKTLWFFLNLLVLMPYILK